MSRLLAVRAIAWLWLGAVAAVYVWMLYDQWVYVGLAGVPPQRILWLLPILFIILPWALNPLCLVGFWILFDIRRKGSGRWWWRWWGGGLLSLLIFGEAQYLSLSLRPYPTSITNWRPTLDFLINVAAIPSLWVLNRTSRVDRELDCPS
jgi:hypothetical protein